MSYWIARGCLDYGRTDAAKSILEKAVDAVSDQVAATGTIWEFYHHRGASPFTSCHDYLRHNPLIAMTLLFDAIASIELHGGPPG
jgi:putative isomerase